MAPIPKIAVQMSRPAKATNLPLTREYLARRAERMIAMGYDKPKWISFCEAALDAGLVVHLYEARRTVSKYVTLSGKGRARYKVRFSNHKPIPEKEIGRDCDFFVGVTNKAVTTTEQALRSALRHFGLVA